MSAPAEPARRLSLTARYAGLNDLAAALDVQGHHRQDIVAPLNAISSRGGVITVAGTGQVITGDGVTSGPGTYRPLRTWDDGLAGHLPGVNTGTLRYMRASRPDIYDEIVNGLVHGRTDGAGQVIYPPMSTNVLMRLFAPEAPGGTGFARAVLSDSYKPMDNVDLFYLVLAAVREAQRKGGFPGDPVIRSNLTEDAMDLQIRFPGITTVALELLDGYRNPFRDGGATRTHWWRPQDGGEPGERGRVDLAMRISNGELGNRALKIAPEAWVWECGNGQVTVSEMVKAVHIGGKLPPGEIQWSQDTQRKAMELATLKLRDALTRFLAPGYLDKLVGKLLAKGAAPVTDPAEAIRYVTQTCGFPQDIQKDLLRHFTLGGRLDAFGVTSAVTSLAQELDDPALALDLEWGAEKALAAAAQFSADEAAARAAADEAEAALAAAPAP